MPDTPYEREQEIRKFYVLSIDRKRALLRCFDLNRRGREPADLLVNVDVCNQIDTTIANLRSGLNAAPQEIVAASAAQRKNGGNMKRDWDSLRTQLTDIEAGHDVLADIPDVPKWTDDLTWEAYDHLAKDQRTVEERIGGHFELLIDSGYVEGLQVL